MQSASLFLSLLVLLRPLFGAAQKRKPHALPLAPAPHTARSQEAPPQDRHAHAGAPLGAPLFPVEPLHLSATSARNESGGRFPRSGPAWSPARTRGGAPSPLGRNSREAPAFSGGEGPPEAVFLRGRLSFGGRGGL